MDTKHCEEVLLRHGIRPTAVRMLVLEATERFEGTFSPVSYTHLTLPTIRLV